MEQIPEDLADQFLPALEKFVPLPVSPPTVSSVIVSLPNSSEDDAENDENCAPRRSNSEPPGSTRVPRSPKRQGDESPRSDTMSPARKVPRFTPPNPATLGNRRSASGAGTRGVAPNSDPAVDEYFRYVAKTGRTLFDWAVLREAFLWKLEAVCREMQLRFPYVDSSPSRNPRVPCTDNPSGEEYIASILDSAKHFTGIPFTIQRLCELITDPLRQYKRADKFFRALEKILRL